MLIDTLRELLDNLDKHREAIEEALSHGGTTHSFDDVCALVVRGQVKLRTFGSSFIISEVIDFPREKHYHLWLCGGVLEEVLSMQETMNREAAAEGCTHITVHGRQGWARTLKALGWKFEYLVMRKPVEAV